MKDRSGKPYKTIVFISLLFLLTLAVIFLNCYYHYKSIKGIELGSDKTTANVLQILLSEHQRAAIALLQSYGNRPPFVDNMKERNGEKILSHLAQLKGNNQEIDRAYASDKNGILLTNHPVDKVSHGKDLSYRDWYKGVSKEWKPYVSTLFRLIVGNKELAVAVCVPVFDRKGQVIGILGSVQRVFFLNAIIKQVSFDQYAKVTLIDQAGQIVYSNAYPLAREVVMYPFLAQIKQAVLEQKDVLEIHDLEQGNGTSYLTLSSLRDFGWTIIVERSNKDILLSGLSYYIQTAAIAILLFIVIIIFFFYISRKQAQMSLQRANDVLEERVAERTEELERVNEELQEDIISRKQAEEALQKSNSLLSSIMDSPDNVIMFALDKNYNYLSFNKAHVRTMKYAYDADIEIGQHILSYIPNEDDRLKAEKNYLRVLKGERFIELQEYGLLENRSWYELIFNPIVDISNQITGFTVLVTDISERKRVEEALRESEDKFRGFAEQSLVGIYLISGDVFKYVNPKFAEIFGYSVDECLDNMHFTQLVHPEDLATVEKWVGRRLSGEAKTVRYSFRGIKKNGETIHVEIFGSSILLKDNTDATGTMLDITEQKQAEEERKRLHDKFQRAQKMEAMGLMAGGVAHDLNNILSGIVSYPELLLMDLPEDSPMWKPIKTIQESGMRAADVVEDLMTIARGVATSKEIMNFNTVVEEYLSSTEHKHLVSIRPSVTFKTRFDPDLLNVNGSPTHIKKILMNLVTNASEAIEGSGTVIISTMNQYLDEPLRGYEDVVTGEYIMLTISDDGLGISRQDLERIFEPFYTKKVMDRSGTGLGLAVVWNTVQDHNGYINVKSSEKGTVFELYFQVTREELAAEKEEVPLGDYLGHGEKILVVDDEERQREIAGGILTKLGYTVEAVSSGEKAIEYIKEHPVELIVLDMVMPKGINGRKTYEEIIKIRPGQKAIIASGYAKTRDVELAQELGAGKYIKKPYTLEKVGLAVKEELEK